MRLSEAIKHGSTLRPESHQERFCYVENRGLCSDAWGAACEAVMPTVIDFNWNGRDRFKFENAMNALRAVQTHYFADYFKMPAQCPGSQQRFIRAGGRIIGENNDQPIVSIYERGITNTNIGGVTTECELVAHMAGMVDHLFYRHRWSRLEVADVVEWYENTRSQAVLTQNFAHYAVN
jgi:hypothetical protein